MDGGSTQVKRGGAEWRLGALLFALTFAVYLPSLRSPYVSDDYPLFARPIEGLAELVRTHEGYMRPLPRLTMWAHFKLFGLDTTAAHLVQVLMHAATAGLVGALALRLCRDRVAALAAAALFALHPIHPTSVSWLSGRFDVMCAGFSLACLLVHDRARERASHAPGHSPGARALAPHPGAVALFLCALASKEQAFCVPLLIVLLDLFQRRERPLLGAWPYVLACALFAAYRIHELGSIGGRYAGLTPSPELLWRGARHSVNALVQPANPAYWENWIGGLRTALGGGLALVLVPGLTRRTVDWRTLAFAAGFTLLSMLPFLAYVAKGFGGGLAGARVLYLSAAGFCIGIGAFLGKGTEGRAPARFVLSAFLALYALVTLGNNLAWREGGKVANLVTSGLAEMFPSFGVEHPILAVSGVPRTHLGTYVFLGTSLRHATREHLEEPHRVVQIGQNVAKSFETLAWREQPDEVFAARWNPKRRSFTDVTDRVREELRVYLERADGARVWSGADLAEWTNGGSVPFELEDGVLTADAQGGLLKLVSPVLGEVEALVFEVSFGGKPAPAFSVAFLAEGDPQPFGRTHLRLSGHPRKQRHRVQVPGRIGGRVGERSSDDGARDAAVPLRALFQVRPPDGSFQVHSIRAVPR